MTRSLLVGSPLVAGAVASSRCSAFPLTDYLQASSSRYVAIYFIAIVGLNILTGYTGQISLGHGAFMAIGGYTTAILAVDHGVGELWTIPLAGLVAGAAGFLFGIPALAPLGPLPRARHVRDRRRRAVAREGVLGHFTGGVDGKTLPLHTGRLPLLRRAGRCAGSLLVVAWLVLRGRSRAGLPGGPRQRGRGGVLRGEPRRPTRRSRSGSRRRSPASPGRCSRSRSRSSTRTRTRSRSRSSSSSARSSAGSARCGGSSFGAALIEFLPIYAQNVSKKAPDVIFGLLLIAIMLIMPTGVVGLARRLIALSNRVTTRP